MYKSEYVFLKQHLNPTFVAMAVDNYESSSYQQAPFVYAHGKLENFCGGDLVSVLGNLPDREAVYHVTSFIDSQQKEQDVILFFWYTKCGHKRGLVVLRSDRQAYNFAKDRYLVRAEYL
jgi:hypothetical protein